MKKLATLSPGQIFNFAGEQFVVLEQRDGAAFVLLAQSKEPCPFNDDTNAENRNNYNLSTLKKRIDEWIGNLPRNSWEAAAIQEFEVNLNCTDRGGGYGTTTVRAAPLTLWQYGKFKEVIPLSEDEYFWLVTPWACRRLRSPFAYDTLGVWLVNSDGDCGNNLASYSYGIRPALLLNSDLLVSLDDEVEKESCDECDTCTCGKTVDLSGVCTKDLMAEIYRRISTAEGEDDDA